jgi:hypothetical protein
VKIEVDDDEEVKGCSGLINEEELAVLKDSSESDNL